MGTPAGTRREAVGRLAQRLARHAVGGELGGLGDDPAAAFNDGVADLRKAFAEEGALDRIVAAPFGPQPGRALVAMRVNEMLLHAWDVARATGQPTDLAPDLAAPAIEQFRAMRASGRGAGMFADPQPAPEGASPMDQLAAAAGRTVV